MRKYLVTIRFTYNDAPKDEFLSGYTQKTITIGVYGTENEAITNGNKALEKFEKYFHLNPHWNVKERFSNLVVHRDRAGAETKYEYDKRDRLIKITDPMGSIKEIEYTVTGKLKRVTDELKRKTEYIYDKRGKLTGVIDAEGGKKEYKYNKTGKLIEIHSWNSNADRSNPIINKYLYDRRGMLPGMKLLSFEWLLIRVLIIWLLRTLMVRSCMLTLQLRN